MGGGSGGEVRVGEYDGARFRHGRAYQATRAVHRDGVSAGLVHEEPSEIEAGPSSSLVFVLAWDERPHQEYSLLGGRRMSPFERGSHLIIPPGLETWWRTSSGGRVLHVHFSDAFYARHPGLDPRASVRPRFNHRDEVVTQAGTTLVEALRRPEGEGLFFDHILAALAYALLGPAAAAPPRRGGLAPWQLARCREYMAAHLGREVSLDELASVVGLSKFHFARAFKTSTGRAPHAYLRALRVARARRLLVAGSSSIAEIAVSIGYETPHAFSRMFHAEVGLTPTAYRRLHGPNPEEESSWPAPVDDGEAAS